MKKIFSLSIIFITSCCAGCGFGFVASDLKPVTPALDYWKKSGMSPQSRLDDSERCGGGKDAHIGFTLQAINSEKIQNEPEYKTRLRLFYKWRECMFQKGYYTDELGEKIIPG